MTTHIRPTTYSVSALPPHHPHAHLYTLHVMEDDQEPGLWYVNRWGHRYLQDGTTVFPPPRGTEEERARARAVSLMTFDEAIATAERIAPTLTVDLGDGRKSPDQVLGGV